MIFKRNLLYLLEPYIITPDHRLISFNTLSEKEMYIREWFIYLKETKYGKRSTTIR